MIIEGILENLIASAIGATALFVIGKLFHDWFFVEICLPGKKDGETDGKKEENKQERKLVKIYRRYPLRHAYKHAKMTVENMRNGEADEIYDPTIIVGIGRGGAIYGSILSYVMDEKTFIALDRFYSHESENRVVKWSYTVNIPPELLSKVLLVAGEFHSGGTMSLFKERLIEIGAKEIRTCVFYYQTGLPNQKGKPDYHGISGKRDCLMPWQEKQFLRTWKDQDDAKKRENKLKGLGMESLKDNFFIMRHAKTDANVEDRFIGSGSPDESINAEGILEARSVGKYLKENVGRLDIIYCSPMKRCIQTATEIRNELGGEIHEVESLAEVNFGNWEGVKRSDIPRDEYDNYVRDQNYVIPGSTESYQTNRLRAKAFLDELVQHQMTGKRILVVTHKSIGRIMVQIIEKKEHLHYRSIPMDNASLRKVVVNDGEMSIPYYIKVLGDS